MWIGHVFRKSKQLDAALSSQMDKAINEHEKANTDLQDAAYSFDAATTSIQQTRSERFSSSSFAINHSAYLKLP